MTKNEWKAEYKKCRGIMHYVEQERHRENMQDVIFNIKFDWVKRNLHSSVLLAFFSYSTSKFATGYCIQQHRWAVKHNMRISSDECERIRLNGWSE